MIKIMYNLKGVLMKKTLSYILAAFLGLFIGIAISFLFLRFSGADTVDRILDRDPAASDISSDEGSAGRLTPLAFEAAEYIKTGDYKALSEMIHPEYGVVIAPYSTVSLSSNKCFTPEEVARFSDDNDTYIWGITDGDEAPIEMTPGKYFSEYVYDYDYLNASVFGVNRIVKSGNSLENLSDIFPDSQFVDLHNPGTQEADFKDWSTLRLVFEEYDGTLMLTAIIHSESTL